MLIVAKMFYTLYIKGLILVLNSFRRMVCEESHDVFYDLYWHVRIVKKNVHKTKYCMRHVLLMNRNKKYVSCLKNNILQIIIDSRNLNASN